MKIIFISIAFIVAIAPLATCEQRCEDIHAITIAVQKESGDILPLQPVLLPELMDSLITLSKQDTGKLPEAQLYQVVTRQYEIVEGQIAGEGIALDGPPEERRVAVASRGIYFLAGSKHPIENFNRFIKENLTLNITDKERGLNMFFLSMNAVFPSVLHSMVRDEMQLESVALNDFRYRLGPKKGRAAFAKWWSQITTQKKQMLSFPSVSDTEGGFVIKYFIYQNVSLQVRQLIVHRDGTIQESE